MWTFGEARRGRTSSQRRSSPITRSGRIPLRSGSLSTRADRSVRAIPEGRSSASTVPGTGGRPSGYKVIFVPFAGGRPSGPPVDVLTGFLDERGKALGRPAGVAVDKAGALLVADDVGNTIWRVTRAR